MFINNYLIFYQKMINLFNKTNDFIKIMNLFNKTYDFMKNDKFA